MSSFINSKAFWDVMRASSPFLQSSAEEINACFLCTGDFISNLIEESSYSKNRRKKVLCEKCEHEAAFLLTFFRETELPSEIENTVKEVTFNDEEAAFFERFFFRYGVAKSEVKLFFQNVSVRSYVSEICENFKWLKRHGGNPDKFASTFYKKSKRPRIKGLNEFRKLLKESVKKYEDASRREMIGISE